MELWGFTFENFDFVGITEFYEDDLEYFARHYLKAAVKPTRLNAGEKGENGYPIDSSFRKEIELFHARDMELYQRALGNRLKRRRL